jgi:hypothetical protein
MVNKNSLEIVEAKNFSSLRLFERPLFYLKNALSKKNAKNF